MKDKELANNFINANYGLNKGNRLIVKFKAVNKHQTEDEKRTVECTVVGEYRDFIVVHSGNYNRTILKADLITKEVEVQFRSGKQWINLG